MEVSGIIMTYQDLATVLRSIKGWDFAMASFWMIMTKEWKKEGANNMRQDESMVRVIRWFGPGNMDINDVIDKKLVGFYF